MTVLVADPAALADRVGEHLGHGGWHEVTQQRVDQFAAATGDRQWLHCDPERAATGPYGGPVAHGFLTLSLIPALTEDVLRVPGTTLEINARVDRVRFRDPVPVGARVRAGVRLVSVRPRPRGFTELVLAVAVEVEGAAEPACTAEVTSLLLLAGEPAR